MVNLLSHESGDLGAYRHQSVVGGLLGNILKLWAAQLQRTGAASHLVARHPQEQRMQRDDAIVVVMA